MAQTANYANGVNPINQSASIVNVATGFYTGGWVSGNDGAGAIPMPVNIGFTPRYVRLTNLTSLDTYEWMDVLDPTKSIFHAGATGNITLDSNSVIISNSTTFSATELSTPPPGYQGPGAGPGGVPITVLNGRADPTKPNLVFTSTAGQSGAPVNANGVKYAFIAIG